MTSIETYLSHVTEQDRDLIRDALYMAALHHLNRRDHYQVQRMQAQADMHDRVRARCLNLWQKLEGADIDLQVPADSPYWPENRGKPRLTNAQD